MGVLGWDVISSGVTILRGVITGAHLVDVYGDNDWSVSVRPSRSYRYLLTNQNGFTNADGTVECEIDPPHSLFGKNAETDIVANQFIGGLANLQVRVQGLWVRDLAHSVYGRSFDAWEIPGWDSRPGKTEIHPIASLLVKHSAPGPLKRRFEFFVFADEGGRPIPMPDPIGAKASQRGNFAIAIPSGAKMTFVAGGEAGMASSVSITTQPRRGYSVLIGDVESGQPGDGKGFYHAMFDVPALFSLRAFLESPWDEQPDACDHIANELAQMKKGKEFDPDLKKLLPNPASDQDIAAKQAELQECRARKAANQPSSLRAAIGPVDPPAMRPQCANVAAELADMKKGEFDPELKKWLPAASSKEIDAKQQELKACLSKYPAALPAPISLRALFEGAYP